jgi:DNA-binding response OmpR family regulator
LCVRRVLEQLNGGSQNKILVVDDEIDIVGWLKHFLTHYGFEVAEAYDGVQALAAVATDKPDLILLDLNMPRMDGRTTIRRLREQEETRDIPIVVLSANPPSDEAERVRMLGQGVKEFLRKPVTMEQLVVEVRKHLESQ